MVGQDKFGTFYSAVCHVCKNLCNEGSPSDALKICQGCKLILYCSVEHQQMHWPQHKSFCKTIQRLTKSLNVAHIFQNAVALSSRKEWCQLRTKVKLLCEVMLKRSLSICEAEILYFPPVCLLCRKFDPANSKVCRKCNCVCYCSDKHMEEDGVYHSKSCEELKLGFDFDISVLYGTLPDLNLDFGGRSFCQSADNFCEAFVEFASKSNKLSNQLVASIYFTILTSPLTFIYTVFKAELHLSDKLIVHLIGSGNFEIQHLAMWDIVFHWLPNLKYLHLILIGPDVFVTSECKICSKCEEAECKLTVEFCPRQLYHNYATSIEFIKPDMIVMFNCGISEFIGGEEDTWQSSIPHITTSNCPVMLTSYTAREAQNDINRLMVSDTEMSVLIHCKKNKFSARKPVRDWEQFNSHSDSLIFYHNAFISILIPKTR